MSGLCCEETGFVVLCDHEVDLTKLPPLTRLLSNSKRCGNVQFQQISVPDHNDRVRELRDIDKRIGATSILEAITTLTHRSEHFVQPTEKSRYYLLEYSEDHNVTVHPFRTLMLGARKLGEIELKIELRRIGVTAALVEVDKRIAHIFRGLLPVAFEHGEIEPLRIALNQCRVARAKPEYGGRHAVAR